MEGGVMVKVTRPLIVLLAFLGALTTTLAYLNTSVPRGILLDLLAFAALAGAASGIQKEPDPTWSRRIVWLACGALLLTAVASIAWMPPWIFLVALGFVASVCRRRSPRRWALARALGLLALGALLNVYILGALATSTPMSADLADYRALDLRAHTLATDMPLHDVLVIDLPGGGEGRKLSDLADLPAARADPLRAVVPLVLTAIRLGVGWVLGWETEAAGDPASSYANRLTAADRARCVGTCDGARSGPFGMRTLYTFDREVTREVQNRTVHALLTMALAQADGGYRLFVGVYVKRTNWFTPVYMATVDPFRRLVVYPIGFRALQRRWQAKWGTGA
jgi:hypothetical protein